MNFIISHQKRCPPRQRGFTIHELLVTLALSSGLVAGGVGLTKGLQSAAMTTSANDLMTHLQRARSEAIKRKTKVVMCPSTDLNRCAEFEANYTSWRLGWIVYADANENGKVDAGETLSVYAGTLGNFAIRSSRSRKRVTYQPTGMAGGATITFALCHERDSSLSRYVVVSNTGRPRVAKTSTSDVRCS